MFDDHEDSHVFIFSFLLAVIGVRLDRHVVDRNYRIIELSRRYLFKPRNLPKLLLSFFSPSFSLSFPSSRFTNFFHYDDSFFSKPCFIAGHIIERDLELDAFLISRNPCPW